MLVRVADVLHEKQACVGKLSLSFIEHCPSKHLHDLLLPVRDHYAALCRLEANKFADWTQEEFEARMLPNRHSTAQHPTLQSMRAQGASVRVHEPRLTKAMLPSTVDWRGTPADSPVKDQAACGSCWVGPSSLLMSSFSFCPCVSSCFPCFTQQARSTLQKLAW